MVETRKNLKDVYPNGMPTEYTMTVDGGPMSISHWGMFDINPFGVVYMPDGRAIWQKDGETFEVRRYG